MARIFGATYPEREKQDYFKEQVALGVDEREINSSHIPYNLVGIFSGCHIPAFPVDVQPLIKAFVRRMAENDYKKRAGTDEVLRFFTSLNLLCKAQAVGDHDQQAIQTARLILLSKEYRDPAMRGNIEKFDYLSQPAICKAIVTLHAGSEIKEEQISKLLSYKYDAANPALDRLEYLDRLSPNSRQAYCRHLDCAEQFSLYHYLLKHQDSVTQKGIKYTDLKASLTKVMLEGIQSYKSTAEEYKHLPGKGQNSYRGSWFGYKIGTKCEAAELLINTIQSGDVGTFFSAKNKKLRKAAQQGILGKTAKTVVRYLKESRARSAAQAA